MRVLVIDTALAACTAAVFDDERCLAVRSETMARGHSERLGGFVRDAMAEAAVDFETLDRIGVTVGPGSFTGLRVGLAFAQGLGAALDRPVIGVSTLAALAGSVGPGGPVAAVIDARRGEVWLQTFGAVDSGPLALDLEAAGARLAGADWRPVGSGWPLLSPGPLDDLVVAPTPEAIAALTIALDPAAHPPRPLYLRAPDATPPTRLPGQPRLVVGADVD